MKKLLLLLLLLPFTASAATILYPLGGGTGWGGIQTGAIPYGAGLNRLSTTTQGTGGYVLAWLNGIPTWTATGTASGITALGSGWATTTGATITESTSTQVLNGITYGLTIVPSAGALMFTPNVSGTVTGLGASNFTSANISQWTNNSNFISLASLGGTWPIIDTSGTFSFGGLGTSTASGLTVNKIVTTDGSGILVASSTIGNAQLQNSSIVVTTASPLGGAGTIALGQTLALTCTGCLTSITTSNLPGVRTLGNVWFDGTDIVATGTAFTVGRIIATTTATSTFAGPLTFGITTSTSTIVGQVSFNFASSSATSTFGGLKLPTGGLTIPTIASKILLTDSSGNVQAYGGAAACSSHNFVTTISALGASTCGTDTISGITLGGTLDTLSATNGSLTFSASYTGAANTTVGLNVGNANTWTGQQIFNTANVGIATATPWGSLSVTGVAGDNKIPFIVASSTNAFLMAIDAGGHVGFGGSIPTTGTCGTSPGITGGSDSNFVIHAGTGAVTSCAATFGRPFAQFPACTATLNVGVATTAVLVASVTKTTVTILSSLGIGGDNVAVHCFGTSTPPF